MSLQLNLLPWREERRRALVKLNKSLLLFAAVLGFVLGGAYWGWQKIRLTDYQGALTEITQVNRHSSAQLGKKKILDELKIELHNQVHAINLLQEKRPLALHLLEDLSATSDEKFYLLSFKLDNGLVRMEGIAENDREVARLMTKLQESFWYKAPQLIEIIAQPNLGEEVKHFTITSGVGTIAHVETHHGFPLQQVNQ